MITAAKKFSWVDRVTGSLHEYRAGDPVDLIGPDAQAAKQLGLLAAPKEQAEPTKAQDEQVPARKKTKGQRD